MKLLTKPIVDRLIKSKQVINLYDFHFEQFLREVKITCRDNWGITLMTSEGEHLVMLDQFLIY